MIGRAYSKKTLEKKHNEANLAHIIDWERERLYFPADFLKSGQQQSLFWHELGYLKRHSDSLGSVHVIAGFDMFMSSLMDHLVKKGLFTLGGEPCKDDYMIKGQGLPVRLTESYEDLRMDYEIGLVNYFPRKKEDAEAIARSFFSHRSPAYVTQVLSAQNVDWDISRKHHDSSDFYKEILENQKKLRSEFLKNTRYNDPEFVNAEY